MPHIKKANPLQLYQSSAPQSASFQSAGFNPLQSEEQIGQFPERTRASGNTYTFQSSNENGRPRLHSPSTACGI